MSISSLFSRQTVSNTELIEQVVILQNECSRLSRELDALKRASHKAEDSGDTRATCAGIAAALGIHERTVRQVLVTHPAFERVREQCARTGTPITRDRAFHAWLAAHLDRWPS